jgi:peptidoglycan-N-acetylmuramic acid deacetylase
MRQGSFFCAVPCAAPTAAPAPETEPTPPRQKVTAIHPSPMARQPVFSWSRTAAFALPAFCGVGLIAWALFSLVSMRTMVYEEHRQLYDLSEKLAVAVNQTAILRAELQHFKEEVFSQPETGPGMRRPPAVKDTWTPPPPPVGAAGSFDNGPTDRKMVSLTFDAGSFANAAGAILDTLASRGVHTTMFATGQFVKKNSELVRRILADGHEIGNHTYSHPHLTMWAQSQSNATLPDVTQSMLERELTKANAAFHEVTGRDFAPLWRAPYGEKNSQICAWARQAGYLHIGWRQGRSWRESLDSNDWIPDEETPGYHKPDEVYDKIMTLARSEPYGINGGIVLMHLGTERKSSDEQVHRILGKLIDDLRSLGYEIVPVSAMVAAAGINLDSISVARR